MLTFGLMLTAAGSETALAFPLGDSSGGFSILAWWIAVSTGAFAYMVWWGFGLGGLLVLVDLLLLDGF